MQLTRRAFILGSALGASTLLLPGAPAISEARELLVEPKYQGIALKLQLETHFREEIPIDGWRQRTPIWKQAFTWVAVPSGTGEEIARKASFWELQGKFSEKLLGHFVVDEIRGSRSKGDPELLNLHSVGDLTWA